MSANALPRSTASTQLQRPAVLVVVQQHAEEAAHLRHVRSVLVRAPHVGLLQLGRCDERMAAHLDGLLVAGSAGRALSLRALQEPGVGEVFAATALALVTGDAQLLKHVLALVPALPQALRGVNSALGWVAADHLRGLGQQLLHSTVPHERKVGLAACRMHLVDPGPVLETALKPTEPAAASFESSSLLIEAVRTAAALGRQDLLPRIQQHMGSDHGETAFWAAWGACLLGDRQAAPAALRQMSLQPDLAWAAEALRMAMLASPAQAAAELAQALSSKAVADPGDLPARRRQLRALGLLGQARMVPWIIERMSDPLLMRLAGECFSWITGADLARQDLETLAGPAVPERPSDDPEKDDVDLDEDESLPWPDVAKVQAWWGQQAHQNDLGSTQRLFSGLPMGSSAALRVLRLGTQRQRAQAALLRSLSQPGVTLFPVAAPTSRQKRWLAHLPE